jgi:hypothetical protein
MIVAVSRSKPRCVCQRFARSVAASATVGDGARIRSQRRQPRHLDARHRSVLAFVLPAHEGRGEHDLANRASGHGAGVQAHELRARDARKPRGEDEPVMLAYAVEGGLAHRDREEGGVDRLASRVAEIGHGKTRGAGEQEPVAMAALLEEPRLRQSGHTQVGHAEHQRIRQRRRGGARREQVLQFPGSNETVHAALTTRWPLR